MLLDGLRAARAVAPHAGEHDGDGPLALILGEALEEGVDGVPARVVEVAQQRAVQERAPRPVRQHVHVVGAQRRAVLDDAHGQEHAAREEVGHEALAVGAEVRHHHEGRAAARRQAQEEAFVPVERARRAADATTAVSAAVAGGSGRRRASGGASGASGMTPPGRGRGERRVPRGHVQASNLARRRAGAVPRGAATR